MDLSVGLGPGVACRSQQLEFSFEMGLHRPKKPCDRDGDFLNGSALLKHLEEVISSIEKITVLGVDEGLAAGICLAPGQPQEGTSRRVQLVSFDLDPVPAHFLGAIESGVSPGHKAFPGVPGAAFGDSEAGGDPADPGEDMPFHGYTDALREEPDIGDLRAGCQDQELLPAPPSQGICSPEAAQSHLAEALQDRIPGCMAMAVVNLLEVIQIQEDERKGMPVSLEPLNLQPSLVLQSGAVPDTRKSIGGGSGSQFLLQAATL